MDVLPIHFQLLSLLPSSWPFATNFGLVSFLCCIRSWWLLNLCFGCRLCLCISLRLCLRSRFGFSNSLSPHSLWLFQPSPFAFAKASVVAAGRFKSSLSSLVDSARTIVAPPFSWRCFFFFLAAYSPSLLPRPLSFVLKQAFWDWLLLRPSKQELWQTLGRCCGWHWTKPQTYTSHTKHGLHEGHRQLCHWNLWGCLSLHVSGGVTTGPRWLSLLVLPNAICGVQLLRNWAAASPSS